jgi:hypothetical protein
VLHRARPAHHPPTPPASGCPASPFTLISPSGAEQFLLATPPTLNNLAGLSPAYNFFPLAPTHLSPALTTTLFSFHTAFDTAVGSAFAAGQTTRSGKPVETGSPYVQSRRQSLAKPKERTH